MTARQLPPPPPQRLPDPILKQWDAGARSVFSWVGGLVLLAVFGLAVTFGLLAVLALSSGESSIGWTYVFWALLVGWCAQRLARHRRR